MTMDKLKKMIEQRAKIISNQHLFEFPEFVSLVRESICVTKQQMAIDLKMNYPTLFNIEKGKFCEPMDDTTLKEIAEYLAVDFKLLKEKCYAFTGRVLPKC